MSTKKINSVLDFPKPTVNTQLRSFLGLANYFKDFVPNHSNVVSPLFKMIDHSATKQTSLKWTKDGEAAFKNIQQLIADSPTLRFIHPTAPIVLVTDASDYGIGGYLYQVVDNIKQLVALVSKALTSTQLAWSVIQKEAYAIFFCCTHLDAMLRDRKFTILTDHENLSFIKQASNPMIVLWHLALQELDFYIQFVAGIDNEIADAMSRLCINN
jgi:RNase H-like domain found in reverse transcriptase